MELNTMMGWTATKVKAEQEENNQAKKVWWRAVAGGCFCCSGTGETAQPTVKGK